LTLWIAARSAARINLFICLFLCIQTVILYILCPFVYNLVISCTFVVSVANTMQLSLQQTADILGKTRRQVLYMIEQGHLPAKKIGGRWAVDRADLQVDAATEQRVSQKQAQFKAVIEDALTPGPERRYTLRDLKAVQLATPIYRELATRGAGWEKATRHMRECLDQLALGCHRYDRQEKTSAYRAARDAASLAAMELLLHNEASPEDSILGVIEQELMPAFAGLLRRSERRTRTY
jgi:excisionase family DNA binding protein